MLMRISVAALVIVALFAGPAAARADEASSEAALVAANFVNAVNAQDVGTASSMLTSSQTLTFISGGRTIYTWKGPDAFSRWMGDVARLSNATHVSTESIVLRSMNVSVEGDQAVVTGDAAFAYIAGARPGSAAGTILLVLTRSGRTWKVSDMTWRGA